MADVSKVKSRLGSPPESKEAKGNLRRPEELPVITDGRSLRATSRTAQLSTRVKPETLHLLRQLAARDGITMASLSGQSIYMLVSSLIAASFCFYLQIRLTQISQNLG
jgi:hypothetical protein